MSGQQDLLEALFGGDLSGWERINQMQQTMGGLAGNMATQQSEQADYEAAITAAALDNPAGRKFLEILMRKTVVRGKSDKLQLATSADMYGIEAAEHFGRASVMFTILAMLSHARGMPKPEGGTT